MKSKATKVYKELRFPTTTGGRMLATQDRHPICQFKVL